MSQFTTKQILTRDKSNRKIQLVLQPNYKRYLDIVLWLKDKEQFSLPKSKLIVLQRKVSFYDFFLEKNQKQENRSNLPESKILGICWCRIFCNFLRAINFR